MKTTLRLLLPVLITGCTANNTLMINAPITASAVVTTTVASNTLDVAAPVTASAVVNTTVASNTVKVAAPITAPVAIAAPVVVAPAAPVVVIAQPSAGGGGSGGGGGGQVVAPPPPPPPAPTPEPTPEPTPRPEFHPATVLEGHGASDTHNLKLSDTNSSSAGSTRFAQTFKLSKDGRLGAVTILLGTLNSQEGPDTEVSIYATDDRGRPTGAPLGQAVIYGENIGIVNSERTMEDWIATPSTTMLPAIFTEPIPVASNTLYAWVIKPLGPQQYPGIFGTKADSYADGRAWSTGTDTWVKFLEGDFVFETFVLEEGVSGADNGL
jgi:hypothetical protein